MRSEAAGAIVLIASMCRHGALAQPADLTGRWSFSGLILSGRSATSFAQICDLKQTGEQLAGSCRGPNGGCPAVGVVSPGHVDLTCRLSSTLNPAVSGVLTFNGEVDADDIFRGPVSHSRVPDARGTAALMRI